MKFNIIRDWGISVMNPYTAPECRANPVVCGYANVAGLTDGQEKGIYTSRIASVNGRTIRTITGSIYTLHGEPNQYFLDMLREFGYEYNSEKPLDCFVKDQFIVNGG